MITQSRNGWKGCLVLKSPDTASWCSSLLFLCLWGLFLVSFKAAIMNSFWRPSVLPVLLEMCLLVVIHLFLPIQVIRNWKEEIGKFWSKKKKTVPRIGRAVQDHWSHIILVCGMSPGECGKRFKGSTQQHGLRPSFQSWWCHWRAPPAYEIKRAENHHTMKTTMTRGRAEEKVGGEKVDRQDGVSHGLTANDFRHADNLGSGYHFPSRF